ncbi:fimbrial protein [Klebsiella aerogenes]|uniref:fimbrial protein n=1 Tax=Klebsiella aerogenes TaxID=548 RepID=UPI0027EBAF0A|nr:fimbrial protein [Klebsiella aerogenes]EKU0405715.1 fimbrial protein [Klebsiella aerogenes]EKZ3166735.1 fimbrial protein [Klebsiella aerogenes]MDT4322338.1 fimbrial protein [Klebsiella aerogenes]MEB5841903.1 fimbrial protein [Klebsiella aerogenes]MEB5895908.1 fimbrial protein [Klebsiella aerogenes]
MYYKNYFSTHVKCLVFLFTGIVFFLSGHSWAYDGTINVTGNIIDGSCDIDTDSIDVNLGNVPVSSFQKTHDTSNPVPFNITLSNCSASIKGADIMFVGVPDDKDFTLLKLTQDSGVAGNAAVRITQPSAYDGSLRNIVVYLNTRYSAREDIKDGTFTMTYALQYQATAMPVTAGTGNAIMYFNIYYR